MMLVIIDFLRLFLRTNFNVKKEVERVLGEKRMKSYVNRGNELIAKGKEKEAMSLVESGLKYYLNNIIKALRPYATADAGLIILALRHVANEIEANNVGSKEFAEGLDKCIEKPHIPEQQKVKKPNRY